MSSSSASEMDRLLEGFAGYLRGERGVSAFTVDLYVSDVRRFLAAVGTTPNRAAGRVGPCRSAIRP